MALAVQTCHGRVDKMPLMWQAQPLTMEWCLGCHRHPERYVRPRDQVFAMDYAYATRPNRPGVKTDEGLSHPEPYQLFYVPSMKDITSNPVFVPLEALAGEFAA